MEKNIPTVFISHVAANECIIIDSRKPSLMEHDIIWLIYLKYTMAALDMFWHSRNSKTEHRIYRSIT